MQFVSWNVNGLRAAVRKGFEDFFKSVDADCFCIQETKLQDGQIALDTPGYGQYWNFAAKKGYSGTAIFSKREPLSASYGIGQEVHDQEGRVITLEWADFYLVNVYTPNSRRDLERLPYRMEWEDAFRAYLLALDARKPGDRLWRYERSPPGNRSEEFEIECWQFWLYIRGAGKNVRIAAPWIC